MANTRLPDFSFPLLGLTTSEVETARQRFGRNETESTDSASLLKLVVEVVSEPMFILLAVASLIYVLLRQWEEGLLLALAMLLVAGISLFQTVRSNRALQALRALSQNRVSVLRNGELLPVPIEEIVVGDLIWVSEGQTVPADGILVKANDCSVDEAILTGESVPVAKTAPAIDRFLAGTMLTSGSAYVRVTSVGTQTEVGKLGHTLQSIKVEKTPLQRQINGFVQRMAWVGFGAFALVWGINYSHSGDWATSLLLGLTIAMSVLPEEIPVAFSSFMALGAARMIRLGVLTRQPQTVESLGSASVICTDKTGTITQEGMTVVSLYDGKTRELVPLNATLSDSVKDVLVFARWASEPTPFDPMERAIESAYQTHCSQEIAAIQHEYPLDGTPPMMTHVYGTGPVRVAGKGAVERIVRICHLSEVEKADILRQATRLAKQGYRVLGIAGSEWPDIDFPVNQDDFQWVFKGMIALENPPKANARAVLDQFHQAGITVKMLTGDSPETAQAIASQVAIPNSDHYLTGQQVMALSETELQMEVKRVTIFARMFPDAKLRVIRALKANGEVVAMTGDGVNDGPALKAAHIGVAMGRRGTEVAKQAAALVLVDDDLNAMVGAIAQGRRIYQNLKRAVGYIVSIHIPIILTVTVPLLFGWRYVNLFSPIHIIFLELVMGPTSSIAFENEPAEPGLMRQRPRRFTDTFFTAGELGLNMLQGVLIALVVLGIYYQAMLAGAAIDKVRTMTFVTLVLSNVWLTLVNRSKRESVLSTIRRPNSLFWLMLFLTLLMLMLTLVVPTVRRVVQFTEVTEKEMLHCFYWSLSGVVWIEGYKYWKRVPLK
ncbi:cation-translocating P-type ATPase [Larkinella rosea]|uniref:Cation-translocating P-type ATPase n=1 Tax=Larkinella rosea TaxID=2025312 RepID=A0A3P1BFY5_9BACT|nr:cation-translocating P-type ATPase [Larkinella rosea]RRB00008.1 cation-translocating P-type ATPase [Larkinella rosea]